MTPPKAAAFRRCRAAQLRLRELAQEIQRGLARFLTRTLEQLRPEAETQAGKVRSADDDRVTLVHVLEAALRHEGASGGEVASPREES